MDRWFERNKDIGLLILRLFVGIRLIYGVQDNILNWHHMKEFETFLVQHRFPFPLISAIVSVYAQALAGILLIAGFQVRWAAVLMIINFLIAMLMVHVGQTFEQLTTVLFMLISSMTLLFTGAGRFSIDGRKSPVVLKPQEHHRNIQQKRE
jgi:putative oxidoreductase